MTVFFLLLLTVSFVFFLLAALNVPARFNLVAAGLALWVLVPAWQLLRALT
jgi:hypothetical protein